MTQQYATEAPFVVSTRAGGIKSTHWTAEGAKAAAKASKTYRVIHGRHQGVWRPLACFEAGRAVPVQP